MTTVASGREAPKRGPFLFIGGRRFAGFLGGVCGVFEEALEGFERHIMAFVEGWQPPLGLPAALGKFPAGAEVFLSPVVTAAFDVGFHGQSLFGVS